jgi:hypothetical protein
MSTAVTVLLLARAQHASTALLVHVCHQHEISAALVMLFRLAKVRLLCWYNHQCTCVLMAAVCCVSAPTLCTLQMLYVRGFLTEIEAKRVGKQLLQALVYLHQKG